jgi:hypothetical protein
MRLLAGTVQDVAVDGHPVSAARYRWPQRRWQLAYVAPPDTGMRLALSVPAGQPLTLELTAMTDGLPAALAVPARPASETPAHKGDQTLARRVVRY